MKLLDALLGRRKPVVANLDALFGLPTAAITLQTAASWTPAGVGAVCYRETQGAAFASTEDDIVALLDADDGPAVERTTDGFGFSWLAVRHDPAELSGMVTDLHAVNTSLRDQGFGPGLLCSLVAFVDTTGRRLGLVYLYKQGTFYPFVPTGPQSRDNVTELAVRDLLRGDLPIEPDLGRWMGLWGAPGI